MRLLLLPISTRRTFIYCQRLNVSISEKESFVDKQTKRAAKLWASWEKKESGWQRKIVDLGNKAMKRVPYEEWGLKSIPPLSQRRKEEELSGKTDENVEVSFPRTLVPENTVLDVLKTLGTERETLHKSRLTYCILGMPLVAPFALVPVIPNLPFFYLVYRAWSHWRALSGSRHIQFLVEKKLAIPTPSPILDNLYSTSIIRALQSKSVVSKKLSQPSENSSASGEPAEILVLGKGDAALIAKALDMPELNAELDRAIWQVETSLKEKEDAEREKGVEAKTASDEQSQDRRNE